MTNSASKRITVLITDDESLARAGIQALLSQARDMEIVGEARDGFEVQELVPKLRPNIALLDYQMPGPGAYELEKWIRRNYPETTALILTHHNRDEYLVKVIDSGMTGFLLKSENAEQLIGAIRRATRGEILFDQAQLARAARWHAEVGAKLDQLTPREREILALLKKGSDNKEIAQKLNISVKTTMYHMTNLFRKLEVKNRQEAALWAVKHLPDNPDIFPD